MSASDRPISVFLAVLWLSATFSKAWEPVSIAIAAREGPQSAQPPFAAVLVACEALKLLASLIAARLSGARKRGPLLSRSSACSFGVPAFFLAVTNIILGFAVPRLNPILYQVLFKGINLLATAGLGACRRPITLAQWGSLLLLLFGLGLTLPDADRADDALLPRDAVALPASSVEGIVATVIGAVSMAIQSVWFEHQVAPTPATAATPDRSDGAPTAQAVPPQLLATDGVAWPTAALAVWGLQVNVLFLFALDASWVLEHSGAVWHGFSTATWGAAVAIALADLTMAVFTKHLGANAYLFSRMIAMVVCAVCKVLIGLSNDLADCCFVRIRHGTVGEDIIVDLDEACKCGKAFKPGIFNGLTDGSRK